MATLRQLTRRGSAEPSHWWRRYSGPQARVILLIRAGKASTDRVVCRPAMLGLRSLRTKDRIELEAPDSARLSGFTCGHPFPHHRNYCFPYLEDHST